MRVRGIVVALMSAGLALAGCTTQGRAADPGNPPSGPADSSGSAPAGWAKLPPSPLGARHEAVGAWVADRFLMVGGWTDPVCPPAASCAAPDAPARSDGAAFDVDAGTWTAIADAPVPISSYRSATAGDRLFLLTADSGRADSPVTFLAYDPAADSWTRHPLPPVAGNLLAVGETVVSIPGSDEQTPAVDAVFDRASDRWRRLPADPLGPSWDRSAAVLGGQLYLAARDLVPDPGSNVPSLSRLARLDGLPGTGARWTKLPGTELIGPGPVAAGDFLVWPSTGSADGGKVNGWGRSYREGGILDPAAGQMRPVPDLRWPPAVIGPWVTVGDKLLAAGHLLDPATRTRVPGLPGGRRTSATVIGAPAALLVWGGAEEDGSGSYANLATGYLLGL